MVHRPVDGGEDALQGGQVDVVAHAHAEPVLAVLILQVDVGHGLGVGALLDGVLAVVDKGKAIHLLAVDGVEEGVDGAVAGALHLEHGVGVAEGAGEGDVGVALLVGELGEGVAHQLVGLHRVNIVGLEQVVDGLRLELLAHPVGLHLDDVAELRVHGLGQVEAEGVLHDEGRAALARLGVDADDGLILPPHVRRVDGQVGHLPVVAAALLHVAHALVDGVLVGAGEGGEHQLAHVGLPLADLHLGDLLVHVPDLVDVGEVQARIHPLGVQVQGQGHHVHVAGALAVAEQGGLHPLRSGQLAQLGGGHALAPVVVGVQGDDGALPAGQLGDEVLDLVGEVVGHAVLHRGGQVEDHLVLRRGVEGLDHRLADLHRRVHLRAHEGLGRVLIPEIHARVDGGLAQLPDQVGGVHGDLLHPLHVGVEHHLPLEGGGGVVEVEDHVPGAVNGLKGLADQVLSGLHQHLDGHVVGDVVPVDEGPEKLILRLRGGGEPHLDLLHADVHQGVEQLQLFLHVHGVNQRLVAVPEIYRAPDGGRHQLLVGPGALFHLEGDEGDVLFLCGLHADSSCSRGQGTKKRP